jgi:hypothetical protein
MHFNSFAQCVARTVAKFVSIGRARYSFRFLSQALDAAVPSRRTPVVRTKSAGKAGAPAGQAVWEQRVLQRAARAQLAVAHTPVVALEPAEQQREAPWLPAEQQREAPWLPAEQLQEA